MNHLTPLTLKSGLTLKNRIVVPPMASETADSDGTATTVTREHYGRLAESGAGLVIVEYTFVHLSGRSEERQLGLSTLKHAEALAPVADLLQRRGARAGLQLVHAGGKSSRALTGGLLMAPSGVRVPVKDREMEKPTAMTAEDIALWKFSFAVAIDRAVVAGFDLVEFHAAHGYGLNQFLSPLTNHGADRTRLLLEMVADARARHPRLALSVRMPGQDFLDGGLTVDDEISLARALEVAGVDVIHVSSGIGGWRRPRDRDGEGYLVNEARQIQAHVGVPVIGVGGIESVGYIDEGLRSGSFALAAVAARFCLIRPAGARGILT